MKPRNPQQNNERGRVLEPCMEADKISFETAAEVANVAVFAVLALWSSGEYVPINRHEIIDLNGLKLTESCALWCSQSIVSGCVGVSYISTIWSLVCPLFQH